jgi:two-component sensor histidine kinase
LIGEDKGPDTAGNFPGERKGKTTVKLYPEPAGKVVLSVADDGGGIPEQINPTKTSTLGLRLVTLVDQPGGESSMRRSGLTEFTLRFPIEP